MMLYIILQDLIEWSPMIYVQIETIETTDRTQRNTKDISIPGLNVKARNTTMNYSFPNNSEDLPCPHKPYS